MTSLVSLDTRLFNLINQTLSAPWLDPFMVAITYVGTWYWLFGLIWAVWMWQGDLYHRRSGLLLIPVLLLSDLIPAMIIKPFVNRPRPFYVIETVRRLADVQELSMQSFPSNHASNCFAVAVFITLALKIKRVSIALIGLAAFVCYSRVYIGVHYPGDVTVGALFGSASAIVTYMIFHKWLTAPKSAGLE